LNALGVSNERAVVNLKTTRIEQKITGARFLSYQVILDSWNIYFAENYIIS